jgi:hypothetical protein
MTTAVAAGVPPAVGPRRPPAEIKPHITSNLKNESADPGGRMTAGFIPLSNIPLSTPLAISRVAPPTLPGPLGYQPSGMGGSDL